MRIDEKNFVSKIKEGDEEAIKYVLEAYGGLIKIVIRKNLCSLDYYEEECINDVLLAVWSNIERFDASKSSFKNWLAAISKYTALNYVRKYKKDRVLTCLEDVLIIQEETPCEIVIKQIEEDFADLLEGLKKEDQVLFVNLYVEQQTVQEISETTGVKKEVIYNRVSRAKQKLKKLFTQGRYL